MALPLGSSKNLFELCLPCINEEQMFNLSAFLITDCTPGCISVTERVAICHYLSYSVSVSVSQNGGAILENTNAFCENSVRVFWKTASVWTGIDIVFDKRMTDNDGKMMVSKELTATV